MKINRSALGLALLLCAGVAPAGPFSVGVRVSTLGAGGEVGYAINDRLAVRAAGYAMSFGYDGNRGDVRYSADLKLASGGVYLDWHPFAGGFRVSVGGLGDGNNITGTGQPQGGSGGTYTINHTTYTAAQVGTLTAKADMSSFAPYLGVGWLFGAGPQGGFGVSLDAGVLYQGSPTVTLRSSAASPPAQLQADLDAEASKFEHDIRILRFYPAISLGLHYRF